MKTSLLPTKLNLKRSLLSVWCVLFYFSNLVMTELTAQEQKYGKIEKVILYRNQALIMRNLEMNLVAGSHEIAIAKLPAQIIANSLYAEATGAEVRAARVKTQELGSDPSPEIKALNDEIEKVDLEVNRLKKMLDVNKQKKAYLLKQQDFIIGTEKVELSKGILNSQTLKDLALFQFEQNKELAEEELKLTETLNSKNKEKNLLVRKRTQLTSTSQKSIEASVFLDKATAGKVSIRIYYLVGNASWSPTYNFYSKTGQKEVQVEFNAHIQQLSGEDWDGVNITLSNATPALSAVAPGLSPFRLSLSPSSNIGNYPSDVKSATQGIAQKMNEAYNRQMAAQSWEETEESSWAMNKAANEFQNLEIIAKDEDLSYLRRESTGDNSAPSVSYTLKGVVSLPSKREQQMIKVERLELPASFYNVATPLLTSYVFREAEIENNGLEVLLEGSASVYLDERFVGKAEISNVARGQSFVMGFGIDSQIRTKRELIDKKEKILGGNKELSFFIRITLENYYKNKMELRILDRIPVEDEKENVRITLDLKGNILTKDELYERYQRPKGLLRWDVELTGDASGSKSKLLEYNYKMEFDKNLNITLPSSQKTDQMRNEFKEIQKLKYKK